MGKVIFPLLKRERQCHPFLMYSRSDCESFDLSCLSHDDDVDDDDEVDVDHLVVVEKKNRRKIRVVKWRCCWFCVNVQAQAHSCRCHCRHHYHLHCHQWHFRRDYRVVCPAHFLH